MKLVESLARLKALKDNLPTWETVPEKYVREFHSILNDLEALRYDLISFRIPNSELERSPIGDPVHRTAVDCDRNILTMKIDGVLNLFHFKEMIDSGKIEIGFRGQRK
jgi:hypothetical protein